MPSRTEPLPDMSTRRLRVLFLASYFPKPDNPYMGTWALSQAQALARQDIDLSVVSFTSWVPKLLAQSAGAKAYAHCPPTHIWDNQVEVQYPRWLYYSVPPIKQWAYSHPQPFLQIAWRSAKQKLCTWIEQFQPDVIFCHHSLPNGWLVSQLPPCLRRPLFTLDHDFDEIADCRQYPQRYAAMQTVAHQAEAMLAVSNRMGKDLAALFPNTHVLTHHNGVDLLPQALRQRPRPIALQHQKIILACALFAERKGIPLLVEAFAQVAPEHPDAILRIVGSGSEEEKIRQTISRLDLGDRVQMVGKKPHAEVLQEMVWADCFALVGWDEPFATVYLEAMAAGTPVICCNDGGINDVVRHGVHGYTVPPKNIPETAKALHSLLSDPARRTEMGINAQRLVQQELTWDVKALKLLQLFETARCADTPRVVTPL
jgi:glycosyltransferase involved in cell wall biosynthesis